MEIIKIVNKSTIHSIKQSGLADKYELYDVDQYGLYIEKKDDCYWVVVIELPSNEGRSVTNAWPELGT